MEHDETYWYRLLSVVYTDAALDIPKIRDHRRVAVRDRPIQEFLTKSKYEGTWDDMGTMTGRGVYVLPNKTRFEGRLDDGIFRKGCYYFPMGHEVDSYDDEMIVWFADGLAYKKDFAYCQANDRRYSITNKEGFKPPTEERLTDSRVDRPIPPGCYDTGDGFYNPELKCVISAFQPNVIVRIPTAAEETWIRENCRKAWDEPVGYKPDLYQKWTSGRKNHEEQDSSSDDDPF